MSRYRIQMQSLCYFSRTNTFFSPLLGIQFRISFNLEMGGTSL